MASLYQLEDPVPDLVEPVVIAAFDGWVDAGGAATTVLEILARDARVVATFDSDQLFDYRSRRPTLLIRDGKLAELDWPEISLAAVTFEGRDVLIFTGAEPDDRWRRLQTATVELLGRLGVAQWISLGAIPAAVAHTRSVPILGTASRPGLLRAGVSPGPAGLLKVPSAALSMLEMAVSASGVPSVGYFAQIPHYVSGAYALAALELMKTLEQHLDVELPRGDLVEESRQLRVRLDAATEADEATRAYVERLESMVDESRQPAGDDLIADIERFLRNRSGDEA
jgi:hypothetical protein